MSTKRDSLRPTCLAMLIVVLGSLAIAYYVTYGFSAVTSDKVRQLALAESPRPLPELDLVDSQNRRTSLRARVRNHRFTVVTLVYTQCTTLCLVTASSDAYLQAKLRQHGLEHQVQLLTLSFDPARDTPEALAAYARRIRADARSWTMATVSNPYDLDPLLDAFGIVVIPDGNGEFVHNGALFLVNDSAELFEAIDPERADLALARLTGLVRQP